MGYAPMACDQDGRMTVRNLALLALFAALQAQSAVPHSGGTNADGCHTNRNTGEYHCHGGKSGSSVSPTYCHVVSGERRCGYARSTCADLVTTYGGHCDLE
jgi:hypothetical protein